MTHDHQTHNGAPPTQRSATDPLRVLSDQPGQWTATGRDPLTWNQARERVATADAADGARSDLGVGDLSTWLARPDPRTGVVSLVAAPLPGRPPSGLLPMRRSAFAHLAAAVKAPADYLLRLPAPIATLALRHGMASLPKAQTSKLLRLAGGEVRAVASDSYAPLDNAMVLDTMERTLRAMGMLADVRVTDLAVGTTLAMRVVLPGEAIAVARGDVIQHGLDVTNGEILDRSVGLTPSTFRLLCTNGMRAWSADGTAARRYRHVGDPERLAERFRDAVPVMLAEGRGLRDAMAVGLTRMVNDAIAEIEGLSVFGFGVADTRAVARDLFETRGLALPAATDQWHDAIQGTAVSVFDVANAITHQAQTRGTADDRLAWESVGGEYLLRRVARR